MGTKARKLFPRKSGSLRSGTFTVGCGEYAKITAYDLCGVCIRVSEVHEDKCACEYSEKPYCLNGRQLGLDEKCSQLIIPMPGCYVLYVCEDDGNIDDATVYLDICTNIENVQAVIAEAGVLKQ